MDMVMTLVNQRPLVIFSKTHCHMCHSIKTLMSGFGANAAVYELDQIPNGPQMERALVNNMGCKPSVPAVFIGHEFVGGANEIMSLHVKSQLVPMLIRAQAIFIWTNNSI